MLKFQIGPEKAKRHYDSKRLSTKAPVVQVKTPMVVSEPPAYYYYIDEKEEELRLKEEELAEKERILNEEILKYRNLINRNKKTSKLRIMVKKFKNLTKKQMQHGNMATIVTSRCFDDSYTSYERPVKQVRFANALRNAFQDRSGIDSIWKSTVHDFYNFCQRIKK